MILATYQPIEASPDHGLNKTGSPAVKSLIDHIGFEPIWCFAANTLKEFHTNSMMTAPNYPEVLYLFETDDYVALDIVKWNTCRYLEKQGKAFDIASCFDHAKSKYCEYLVREIPKDKQIFEVNLFAALHHSRFLPDRRIPGARILDDAFNLVIQPCAMEHIRHLIRNSDIPKDPEFHDVREMWGKRFEKNAFECYIAGFFLAPYYSKRHFRYFTAFDCNLYSKKLPIISKLLAENDNAETMPTYERQNMLRILLSSCYRPFDLWGDLEVERNAPCPCGSGKRFKRCCIDKYR